MDNGQTGFFYRFSNVAPGYYLQITYPVTVTAPNAIFEVDGNNNCTKSSPAAG